MKYDFRCKPLIYLTSDGKSHIFESFKEAEKFIISQEDSFFKKKRHGSRYIRKNIRSAIKKNIYTYKGLWKEYI